MDAGKSISALAAAKPASMRDTAKPMSAFDVVEQMAADSRIRMERLRQAASGTSRADFEDALCHYVQCRYLLEAPPAPEDELYALAELSLSRLSGLPAEVVERLETQSGCTGAKTAMIKKVLLILSLMRGLGLKISEEAATQVETVGQLAALCWEGTRQKGKIAK